MKRLKFCSLLLICLFFVACGSGGGNSTSSIAQLEQQLNTLMNEKGVSEEAQESTRALIKSVKSERSNEGIVTYINAQIDLIKGLPAQS